MPGTVLQVIGLAVGAGCALGALVLLARRSATEGRHDVIGIAAGAESGGVPSSPLREEVNAELNVPPPKRVAASDSRELEPPSMPVLGRVVMHGELVEDRYDPAERVWSSAHRRSSGRVRYMPVGALDGRELIEQDLVDVDRFTSTPLAQGEWLVEVRVPGCEPSVERVHARAGPCYTVATLSGGSELEFDVRLPDGTQPARALFCTELIDTSEPLALGPRPGDMTDAPTCLWTPDDPRVFVAVDDSKLDTALFFVAEPNGASPYDARALCRYVSSAIIVGAETDAPIRVQLREACALRITVAVPERPVLETRRWARAVRLDACEGFDVEGLLASPREVWSWPRPLIMRADFDWYGRGSPWDGGDTLEAWYLQPGRWHVAAGWKDQPASTSCVVEVVPGRTDVALTLGQPATSDWIRARFVVDGDEVAEPSTALEFTLVAAGPERASRHVGGRSVSGRSGRWFEREWLRMEQNELTSKLDAGAPVHLVAWDRLSSGKAHAFVSGTFHTTDEALVLERVAQAEVILQLVHARKVPITLGVDATLLEPSPAARLVLSALNVPLDRWSIQAPIPPHCLECPVPSTLLPGRWRFEPRVSSAPTQTLAPIEMELGAGRQVVVVTLP